VGFDQQDMGIFKQRNHDPAGSPQKKPLDLQLALLDLPIFPAPYFAWNYAPRNPW
jgi:hypothetical protein